MCRLLGIVAAEPYEYGLMLNDAPRSMAVLSNQHSDGWGLGTHLAEAGSEWWLHRSTRCACDDGDFKSVVAQARGRILIAHVRQKSVGPIDVENTHPFLKENWLFAHNGTIKDLGFLLARTSHARLKGLRGATDSELFFAWLLTRLDDAGLTAERAITARVDAVLRSAMSEALARPDFGAINFLLSNGTTLYAHRFGRDLFVLDRVRTGACETAGGLGCPAAGIQQRRCVAVASEPITAEPWEPVAQGALLRIDLAQPQRWSIVK
jgi:glutamine amidotransferase